MQPDHASPDALVAALYDVISGPAGTRDWPRFRSLLLPQARLARVKPSGELDVMDAEGYVAAAAPIFAMDGFFEREVAHRSESFGPIVHRWSTYESRVAPDAEPFQRGVNSFQLVRHERQWRILTILWRAESPDLPLPPRYAGRFDVRRITAEEARPLRLRVLRPGQPPETVVYPADALPDTVHFGAFDAGALVGIGTLQRSPDPKSGAASWQLRGMATAPEARGQGHGAAIVRAAEAHVLANGGREMWFNARVVALGFYERLGYVREGPEFDIPAIGPHYVMRKKLG